MELQHRIESSRRRDARIPVICGLVFIAVISALASASPVTWKFDGNVASAFDPTNILQQTVAAGSPFHALVTFDSESPDQDPAEPRHGSYRELIAEAAGFVDDLSFLGPAGTTSAISIEDSWFNSADSYFLVTEVRLLDTLLELRIFLDDYQGQAFDNDALPMTPPPVSEFERAVFQLYSLSDEHPIDVWGTLLKVTPEPATMSLLAIGALLCMRRRPQCHRT